MSAFVRADTTPAVRCAHCTLPVPPGLVEAGASEQFCCAGCRAVYQTIHACGLSDYYRLLESAEVAAPTAEKVGGKFVVFDAESFQSLYVRDASGGLKQTELVLEGASCLACVWLVEKLPSVVPGVIEARLNLRESSVRIVWDPSKLALSQIARALDRFGYRPHAQQGLDRRERHRQEERKRMIHLAASFALMGNVMLLALALYAGMFGGIEQQFWTFFRWISTVLGSIALAWPGWQFFRSAVGSIRARSPNLDVPICLALLAGWVAGIVNVVIGRGEIYFDTLTVLVFLLLVGRYLQFRQQRKVEDSVELLFSLTPRTARVVRDGRVIEEPTESLVEGDIIEVAPGDLLAADGAVENGNSTINAALLTGESMPVEVAAGMRVHAGTQNLSGVLRVRVEQTGERTRLGQLMKLIEEGIRRKPPIVEFADRVGQWFTVAVSLLAAGVFAYWAQQSVADAIDHAVALLIVTCPCVLGLATPLTISVSIGRLARRGILVKNGVILETLSRGGSAVLDKTGTITTGQMRVVDTIGDASLLPLVAEIERRVSHPIAGAIVEAFGQEELPADQRAEVDAVQSAPGGGVRAMHDGRAIVIGSPTLMQRQNATIDRAMSQWAAEREQHGLTTVLVAIDGTVQAALAIGDDARADAKSQIAALRKLGWRPTICSGDADAVVQRVARDVGIDAADAIGSTVPEGKLRVVERLQKQERVLMVGDGVNDAAALAAAEVGVAVHGGAEASLAAADAYIAKPGLDGVVELVQKSRQTMRVVRRNLGISLCYNLLAGVLAAMGLMNPLLAAIIMPISSATVLSLAITSISRDPRRLS